MKKNTKWLVLTVVMLFGASVYTAERPLRKIEVAVQTVFIPAQGYDNNDHVEAVIVGELPNPCFTLAESKAEKPDPRGIFRVHQYAWLSEEGPCGSGDLIDDPVPFRSTVSLGMLPPTDYSIVFERENMPKGARHFTISKAASATLDNFNYASVTNIEMEDEFTLPAKVSAVVTGSLSSSCAKVKEIRTEVLEDVIIILPIVETQSGPSCVTRATPFRRKIELGTLPIGRYLMHVCARHGKAVYHPFLVRRSGE